VKRALKLALNDAAGGELRRPMRASIRKNSGAAVRVAPDDQILAEALQSYRTSWFYIFREE
jgi:hypothetical protein